MPSADTRLRPRLRPFSLLSLLALLAATVAPAWPALAAGRVPTPSDFLGFPVGADRKVADYHQIVAYLKALDAASPRIELKTIGTTTRGEDLVMAVISSEENLRKQTRLREIARKLADPRGLAESEESALLKEGRLFLLVTCNIHSTEIGASQMAMEWAHALVTAEDEETKRRLRSVVVLLVPSLNPDGQLMEVEWYRKWLGTRYEGGRMPWLYHPYAGHDDNRDHFMLTQKESQALNRVVSHDWFPQVFLDEHQMGANGPRIFTPPYAEPVDPDIHPLIWREVDLIGANMALRLEQAGKKGVIHSFSFDAYWIGGTKNTGWWKNVSGLLTEVASARFASPVYVPGPELQGGRKGLVGYGPQVNFPNPWPGGWWRLRDILDYERIASDAILETCADRREDFLRDMVARARAAIAAAGPREAYRIPAGQRDAAGARRLARLLHEHNVDLRLALNGDVYVPLAQPYGKLVSELLGTQRYPEVRLVAGKDIVRPYDVSAWSLPLMFGVTVEKAELPAGGLVPFRPDALPSPAPASAPLYALVPNGPEEVRAVNAALAGGSAVRRATAALAGGLPAGTFFLEPSGVAAARQATAEAPVAFQPLQKAPEGLVAQKLPRVGLYKPWTASMDEGWTRFVLERYGFAPRSLENKTIREGKLAESLDAIVLPDLSREVIATGKPKREEGEMAYAAELPPDYVGGLEKEGAKALKAFVEGGGTLVAMGSSVEYAIDELGLPARNALAKVKAEDFSCPGSLVRLLVDEHPVTWGLPREVAGFLDEGLALQTTMPGAEMERSVLASYPEDARDVVLSGWIHGEERLTRRVAAAAFTLGKGKVVLLAFRPQHRAQTPGTFPFLFGALYWSALP